MFAAKAGAKHVIGVDMSGIIEQAREIVAANGFKDKITLVRGKMEEITLPDGITQVDIIISEWMGYCLLYETMLFWEDVYNFDMSCIKDVAIVEPLVDMVDPKQVNCTHCHLKTFNMETMTVADLTFASKFKLQATRTEAVHAFVTHWSCDFSHCHTQTGFSTAPSAPYTHWKQVVFYLAKDLYVQRGDCIEGTITMAPNERNKRDLDIGIESKMTGQDQREVSQKMEYKMH